MLHAVVIWLLVATFAGAGLFNAIGMSSAKSNFTRWGYPNWWCYVTGGLETVTAVLIALPGGREAGLILGAVIIAAAALTVLRHREFSHLLPLGVFVALLTLAQISS
jgi:DoxX-like family